MQTERMILTEKEKAVIEALRLVQWGEIKVVKQADEIKTIHRTETITFNK